ncbi:MAG: ATPase [Spirochaetaceae bacterium]|nr:ATPase [Spirochaetaceae bacterium]
MIVPMKKVSLIVLKKERKDALEKLRKAGVMHLETVTGNSKELSSLKTDFSSFERAYLALDEIKASKKKGPSNAASDRQQVQKHVEEINLLLDNKKKAEEVIIKNNRDLERFVKWGDVNPEDFVFLKDKNLDLYLYEIPVSKYYDISDVHTIVVNQDKNICRFIAYSADNSQLKMPAEAKLVGLPEKATKTLKEEVISAKNDIAGINKKLNGFVDLKDNIKKCMKQLEKEIEFENVYSGMGKEEGDAEVSLAWISGFVPEPELASLKKVAAENSWAIYADDPTEEDNVPTKLKNSKAVQILYPVMDFLGTVPGYHEFDISAWFLIFLVIFFAMIFGDAGYGMLMLIIGLVLALKSKIKTKEVPPAMILLVVWALATVAWGTINCSWFGIEAEKLPVCLQNLALPVFAPGNPERDMNLQIFCFILALLQMSIGHIIALLRNIKEKSLKLLADIGSLSILWGMFYVVLMLIVSAEKFPMHNAVLFMIGGGFALSFVFSNYEGSIGKSILESLKNIISVLLGVINFFSDIVSYIRLWAVALAGSAIAQTVNQMAGPMLGNFLIFFGILLLVFGHGLNMVLNALSVIVHGVRLNTLEFTSHVGMAWAGYKYKPFAE